MRKRLLMVAFAALSVASSFAYEIGEYVYTATQRVKITGENIVTNGDFANANEGWTDAAGDPLNADVWSFGEDAQGQGPNGENTALSLAATADAALCRAWQIPEDGTYLVSYDIKGTTVAATKIVSTGANCIDIFLTEGTSLTKGEGDVPVSTVDGFKDFWKTNAYTFEAISSQSLVMHVERLAANTMITNVQIYKVDKVYDDRIIKEKLAYVDKLVATQKFEFDTDNGFIANIVEAMRGMLQEEGALDDPSNVEAMMAEYETELLKWLDLNAADILKDEKKWSSYGDTRKADTWGTWTGGGGRWFHINNGGSNEITDDGDEIGHRYQGGVEGNAYMAYPLTPKSAGTYMFSLDVVGHYMIEAKGDNYTTDWNRDFKGVTVYAGKDQMKDNAEANATMNIEQEGQKVDCGVISNPNAKVNPQKFVVFYDVTQEMVDAGTQVWFGMTYIIDPDRGFTTKLGTNVNIANPQIRLIGVTQELIDYQNEVAKIIAQQGPLKERLQWVNDDLQKKAADGYPWRHDTLTIALEQYQPIYDASLKIIDAEGNVVDQAKIKEMMAAATAGTGILYSDSLLNCVKALNGVRSYFSNINKPIASYKTKIADAEIVRDDDMNALCNKSIIQDAIDAANAKLAEVLAATTFETREADLATLDAQLEELAKAVEAFKADAPMTPIIDIDFANNFEEIVDAEGVATGNYMIKGAKGQMEFSTGSVDIADNTGAPNEKGVGTMSFAKGIGEELLDVLRVGKGSATVNIPEGIEVGDEDVIRFSFNVWFVQLSGGSIIVELKNAADQRLAGFGYCAYGNGIDAEKFNSFNNDANEGMDLYGYATNNKDGDAKSHVDGNKNAFSLIIDNKAKGVQGVLTTTKGTTLGKMLPLNTQLDEQTTIEDTKVAKIVLTSSYGNNGGGAYVGRRCWFDDLKAYKYTSKAEGPIVVGTMGDVNGDGKIDVEDVVGIVNKILGEPAENFKEAYADVTGDGKIDVDDVVAVVNIILGGSESAEAPQLMKILLQNGFKF